MVDSYVASRTYMLNSKLRMEGSFESSIVSNFLHDTV